MLLRTLYGDSANVFQVRIEFCREISRQMIVTLLIGKVYLLILNIEFSAPSPHKISCLELIRRAANSVIVKFCLWHAALRSLFVQFEWRLLNNCYFVNRLFRWNDFQLSFAHFKFEYYKSLIVFEKINS